MKKRFRQNFPAGPDLGPNFSSFGGSGHPGVFYLGREGQRPGGRVGQGDARRAAGRPFSTSAEHPRAEGGAVDRGLQFQRLGKPGGGPGVAQPGEPVLDAGGIHGRPAGQRQPCFNPGALLGAGSFRPFLQRLGLVQGRTAFPGGSYLQGWREGKESGENRICSPPRAAILYLGRKGKRPGGRVGRGTPDGRPDGHFQLRLNIPGQREVQSIAVYGSNASGNPEGGQVAHRENRYWMLGVFTGGRQVNGSHASTLGPYSGQVLFDLFCNDSGWFKEGQHFLAEVTFGDGNKVRSVVRLGAVGVAPPPPGFDQNSPGNGGAMTGEAITSARWATNSGGTGRAGTRAEAGRMSSTAAWRETRLTAAGRTCRTDRQ